MKHKKDVNKMVICLFLLTRSLAIKPVPLKLTNSIGINRLPGGYSIIFKSSAVGFFPLKMDLNKKNFLGNRGLFTKHYTFYKFQVYSTSFHNYRVCFLHLFGACWV